MVRQVIEVHLVELTTNKCAYFVAKFHARRIQHVCCKNSTSQFLSIEDQVQAIDSSLKQVFLNIYSFLEPLMVIIEYVPYGDLLGYLRKSRGLNDTYYKDPDIKPQTSLASQQLMKFAWQIADGMSYLSSKSVC